MTRRAARTDPELDRGDVRNPRNEGPTRLPGFGPPCEQEELGVLECGTGGRVATRLHPEHPLDREPGAASRQRGPTRGEAGGPEVEDALRPCLVPHRRMLVEDPRRRIELL